MPEHQEGKPVSAAEVASYLKGIDFPKSKDEVVEYAEDNGAPEGLIEFLDKLPDKQYTSMADVEHEVGQKK